MRIRAQANKSEDLKVDLSPDSGWQCKFKFKSQLPELNKFINQIDEPALNLAAIVRLKAKQNPRRVPTQPKQRRDGELPRSCERR